MSTAVVVLVGVVTLVVVRVGHHVLSKRHDQPLTRSFDNARNPQEKP